MGILSGVVSYLFGLALNMMDAVINGFLMALGFDLDTFETYFPAAREYYDVIVGFGIGILFIMLIFQIFRNFGIVLDMEAEDPLKMVGKTILFFGMIISARSITNIILRLMTDPYAIFIGTASNPYEFKLTTLVTSMFNSVFSNPFMSIVAMIMMLVMGWQLLKLVIECAERYVVFYFVLYSAPVVFATGAFKSTSQIFKSWCRMLGSQAILLLLNVWSIKLFLSFMVVFEQNTSEIIFYFIIGYAFLKFAQKADTLLRILGLNTASTGDMVRSLGGTIAGIAMAIKSAGNMAGKVATAAGNAFSGGSGASASAAGNTAAAGGAAGGGNGNGIGGMGANAAGQGKGGGGGASPMPEGDDGMGVTESGKNQAKQNYTNDVFSAVRSQLNPLNPDSIFGRGASRGGSASSPQSVNFNHRDKPGGSGSGNAAAPNGEGGEGFGHDGAQGDEIPLRPTMEPGTEVNPQGIDAETREGLSNLARGIPHNKFDQDTNSFSGGGFQEFSGEEANIIGATQMPPADGYSQSSMKMSDGTTATVYQSENGDDANVVQFASVDNGVIQGTISKLDPQSGQMGEEFAFKAVHDSVPGASSFSSHAETISDGDGGSYYLATGAEGTSSFFAPGGTTSDMGASASSNTSYSTGGNSRMDRAGGPAEVSPKGASPVSGSMDSSPTVSGTMDSASPSPTGDGSGISGIRPPGADVHTSSTPMDGGAGHGQPLSPPDGSPAQSASTGYVSSPPPISNPGMSRPGGHGGDAHVGQGNPLDDRASVNGETPQPSVQSQDSPPIHTGMSDSQSSVRRFSRDNPNNVEIFRRDKGDTDSHH